MSLATGGTQAGNSDPNAQLAVYSRRDGAIGLVRTIYIGGNPTGMALTHDGRLLVVADDSRVAFLEVPELVAAGGIPAVHYWQGEIPEPGHTYANISADDAYLFVSDEQAATISVLDLASARRSGFSVIPLVGRIPVGNGPISLEFSADRRYLYSTSLGMPDAPDRPAICRREWLNDPSAPAVPQGAIFVIDAQKARSRPAESVVSIVPAGCTPVRLTLSPRGDVAYVSARGGDEVLAFDTAKLIRDPSRAMIGRVPAGPAPIGLAVVDHGHKLVVSASGRFGATEGTPSLVVVDTGKFSAGADAILGKIAARALPREMRITSDGETLLVVNSAARQLQVIDLARAGALLTAR